ncbi:uncharacterized protein LOC128676701 isoform X1 [Plodia interpunctella]|uniref:uncharacterized protein LOC128676701 isoform X1 n=1 Tax=Plodia interpunctella TaxID=58824 RepID=UPI002367C4C3|nr:uncharacterized protein LOC128676701 isoform X1 [Plodia interpunctella]
MDMTSVRIRIVLLVIIVYESYCLKNIEIKIPDAAERNAKVVLECHFELEKQKMYIEELYQVKWHHENVEFCRYEPRSVPPLKIFPIDGIDVVREETTEQKLTIIPRSRGAAQGHYMCEVTADYPSFETLRALRHMYIVDLPKDYPELTDLKRKYKLGSKLVANCSSEESLPAANLTFFVNGFPARPQHIYRRVDGVSPSGLMSSYSSLQFTVQRRHINKELKIKVKCAAYIYSIYWRTNEKTAMLDYTPPTTTPSAWNQREEALENIKPKPTAVKAKADSAVMNRANVYYLVYTISITLLLPSVLK